MALNGWNGREADTVAAFERLLRESTANMPNVFARSIAAESGRRRSNWRRKAISLQALESEAWKFALLRAGGRRPGQLCGGIVSKKIDSTTSSVAFQFTGTLSVDGLLSDI